VDLLQILVVNNYNLADRKAEIGYWLGERFIGKGLMTKTCCTLGTFASDELGMHKVGIHCATDNIRSCAIPKRLGFTHEGLFRDAEWLYDYFVDLVVFGMPLRAWHK
jgi:ribosomal-protein-serine acetyltransferase